MAPVCAGVLLGSTPDDADGPGPIAGQCSYPGCSGGVLTTVNATNGTACGAGGTCQGGLCSTCNVPLDCGVDFDCTHFDCVGGTCMILPSSTFQGSQVVADCKQRTCNGSSTTPVEVPDLQDKDDANACTYDECTAGMAYHTPDRIGLPCGNPGVCNASGVCQSSCAADAECSGFLSGRDCLDTNVCGCDDPGDCHGAPCMFGKCTCSGDPDCASSTDGYQCVDVNLGRYFYCGCYVNSPSCPGGKTCVPVAFFTDYGICQ